MSKYTNVADFLKRGNLF